MEKEFVQTAEAAKYLDISIGTLQNWITRKRFTAADGLRRFGGSTRIHMPTLKARVLADELLKGGAPPQVITPRKNVRPPRKAKPKIWHFESAEPAESPDLLPQMAAAAGR